MKALLTSREFWVTLFTLFVIVMAQFIPGFKLPAEDLAGLVLIAVSYIVGTAVDPGPGGWKGVILSRKFWTAVVGVVIIFLDAFGVVLPVDLTPGFMISLVLLVAGLITSFAIKGPPNPQARYVSVLKTLVESREFWVTLFTLFVLIMAQVLPGFKLPIEDLVGLVLIAVAYIVGSAVDPGPGGWKGVLLSRKFWSAVVGILVIFLDGFSVKLPLDLTPELMVSLALLICGLITKFAVQGPPDQGAEFEDLYE